MRWRDEHGWAAGLEAVAFGVLVFVIGTLVVVNGWAVVDAKFATNAAAREAVRAIVEAPAGTGNTQLQANALNAARQATAAHGHHEVTIITDPTVIVQTRCAPVRATASIKVRSTVLPGIAGPRLYDVTSTHEEVIDPFRSGLSVGAGVSCGF